MRLVRNALFASIWVASSLCFAQLTLRVDTANEGKAISRDLVGIFFEDLNYAADGGLYAELIQNRSFEYSPVDQVEWGPLTSWDLEKRGGGDGRLSVGNVRPIHLNNPHYIVLNVAEPGDGVGVANAGFDQIPLVAGESYEASFWAYQAYMGVKWGGPPSEEEEAMPLSIQLEDTNGDVLAKADFVIKGREWNKHTVELTPSRTVDAARFVILAGKAGGVALDMVSLFPRDTFKGRQNGLRKDLAETLAELRPKFMRFPGGCLVHGQGIHQYYDWKDSVGPLEQRKTFHNLWGYSQTLGFGYFEFFQFCEDLQAIPIPVVSAGVCCQHSGDSPNRGQEGLPLSEMPAYVQDVLDLVEWANGPADSKWGSVRAEAGHPEPFGLKYLGVGNEDEITPIFEVRFKMIRDAVAERYPDIVVIGTSGPFASGVDYENGWKFAKAEAVELVDEHYYVKPDWFWENQHRYDAYDRNGPQVYVGEYAAHEPDRRNTLRSALAEAAGLISYERNADIVKFASYAPLLARRGHTQWTPDLIYFDAQNVYPSINYQVQKLFSHHSGDRLLPLEIDGLQDGERLVASAVRDSSSGEVILKVVNGSSDAQTAWIDVGDFQDTVSVTVLSHPDPTIANEDHLPPQVLPQTRRLSVSSPFEYELSENSLTIFRSQN